jgi:adenylate cyclase
MEELRRGIIEWLLAPATASGPVEIFDELARRLSEGGLELHRGSASLMTKHPDVFGKQLIWVRGKGTRAVLRSHAIIASAMYMDSPVAYVRREQRKLRARLDGPADELRYEIYRELQQAGATDYIIFPMPFRSGLTSMVSWTTDRPEGFRDDELELLESLVPALSLRWELESATYSLETLLSTYLGANAASRVLAGEFKRRTGSRIHAVIWASDLRGFTTMIYGRPMEEVLRSLDEYFDCAAEPVARHGGEVLKFIGDAVLAVFPIGDEDPAKVCARALAAVADAQSRLVEVNTSRADRGEAPLRFGTALHVGEVIYGNIGVTGRLDFTAIGRAVNEVCRVETMTKALDEPVLLSRSFVEVAGTDSAESRGVHNVSDVGEVELFAPVPIRE